MPLASARAGAEGRARGERARAQAKVRAEWRGYIAEKIATARAAAVVANGIGGVGAQPLAASFAERIDALHSEAGQILHFSPSVAANNPFDSSVANPAARIRDPTTFPWRPNCSPRIVQNQSVA